VVHVRQVFFATFCKGYSDFAPLGRFSRAFARFNGAVSKEVGPFGP
jgi:hypothetical protein